MTGNDFTLDFINNRKGPDIVCVDNNWRQNILIQRHWGIIQQSECETNQQEESQLKSSVIIDDYLLIYFRGPNNLIATARSNKSGSHLGFQDYSQLNRDYEDKESK